MYFGSQNPVFLDKNVQAELGKDLFSQSRESGQG